jgi:phosphopantetheinyl transferase
MPTKTAVLKLNGKVLDLNPPSPSVLKLQGFLDARHRMNCLPAMNWQSGLALP